MKFDFLHIVRYVGRVERSPKTEADDAFICCPSCGGLLYDEGLPYDEFSFYLRNPSANLVCDGCEANGEVITSRDVFLLVCQLPNVPDRHKVPFARYAFSCMKMGDNPSYDEYKTAVDKGCWEVELL